MITVTGPYDEQPLEVPDDVRTIDTRVGEVTRGHFRPGDEMAWWSDGDDRFWTVWIDGDVPDDVLADLAESVRLDGDVVDVSGWSEYDHVTEVRHSREDPPDPRSRHDRASLQLRTDWLSLSAEDDYADHMLLDEARAGDQVVEVNGDPALLRSGQLGDVIWVTDGVRISIQTRSRTVQPDLLEIARSVGPVPADDERLAAAWTMPTPDDPAS